MARERCAAAVWRRDTYRYTGRSKSGFTMHYNRGQCARFSVNGEFCRQHAKKHKEAPGCVSYYDRHREDRP